MIQITCIQIDNFGPFTEKMGDNREHKIQILLSELFIFLQKAFNRQNGLVFFVSKDNMIAVSNGISVEDHYLIIQEVEKKYPITISMGIGIGKTPIEAEYEASSLLISKGSAQSSRKKVLAHNGQINSNNHKLKIAHVDINFYTKIATDVFPLYSNFFNLKRGHITLMEAFREIGALCFFNGGDNFICVCPSSVKKEDIKLIIEEFEIKHVPWTLKAGIGCGHNILEAISKANSCLRSIRENNNVNKVMLLN
ncbi:MAG: GTP cyclohydrolase IIa [Promethearchaeota archaeon]